MSLLSQFYSSGGGAADGYIQIKLLVAAGGGGGGHAYPAPAPAPSASRYGGGGGGGGLYEGYVAVAPGSTCPITVGGAGSGATVNNTPGSQGGASSFTTPVRTIRVVGGGGGRASQFQSSPVQPEGGSAGSSYYDNFNKESVGLYSYGGSAKIITTNGDGSTGGAVPRPDSGGYYGSPAIAGNDMTQQGGGAGGNVRASPTLVENSFKTDIISGSTLYLCSGGFTFSNVPGAQPANSGNGGAGGTSLSPGDGSNGGSGTVIVRYPTQFGAATSFPGGTDLTPTTSPFGFRTYQFNSSGSITLP